MLPAWLARFGFGFDGHPARGISSRGVPARSVRAGAAILLLAPHLVGCYHHVPVANSATPIGTTISVGVTDRGRAGLSDLLGSGVQRISGRVVESTDSVLVLSVTSAEYFNQPLPARWAGERVELSRDFVSDIRERRLSRSRTWIIAGIVAALAVAASVIVIGGAFGGEPGDHNPGGGGKDPD